MNLIILGPAGSGKGTQAEKIAEKFNLVHIDMGRVLRQLAQMDTPLGRETNEIINKKRELVPTRIAREILNLELNSISREQGMIFDGVPRNMEQKNYIEEELRSFGRKIDKVFYIDISEEVSVERIKKRVICQKCKTGFILGRDILNIKDHCPLCKGVIMQRKDDTPEGVKKRLKIFQEETRPILEGYDKQRILIKINGEENIKEVFNKIISNFKF